MLYDYIEYWAAARLLLSGGNPYSIEQLYLLQTSIGWTDTIPLIMWNPPWVLPLLIPFAYLNFVPAQLLWILFLCVLAIASTNLLWRIYGGKPTSFWLGWAVALTFAPTVITLLLQQIGLVTTFGIVGFLHFIGRDKPLWAGASLLLAAAKPHLVYLLWLILLLWSMTNRSWSVITGLILATVVASAIPLALNPQLFNQYIDLYRTAPPPTPREWETPTLARSLRLFIDNEKVWLQYLPVIGGIIWAIVYWSRRKANWVWRDDLPLVLLMSVTTNFFAWTADQVIALPALIQATVWTAQSPRPSQLLALTIYSAIGLAIIAIKFFTPFDFWYFWLATVWCLFYLHLRRTRMAAATPITQT